MLDSVLHVCDIMDQITPPSIKTLSLMPKHPCILDYPNVPASNKDNLSKERFAKSCLACITTEDMSSPGG